MKNIQVTMNCINSNIRIMYYIMCMDDVEFIRSVLKFILNHSIHGITCMWCTRIASYLYIYIYVCIGYMMEL